MSAWTPQTGPQADAIAFDWCPELFYGGAAGGGKSDFLLGDYLQDMPKYGQAWQGIIFRRTYPELEELQARSREIYPPTGAMWSEARRTWTWANGASLKMRYLERDQDATRYLGHQYAWIGWDELTQWPSLYAYRYLRARLRSAHNVPTKRIRAAANPGGPGHLACKAYFIDPAPMGYELIKDPATGAERMFIPAKLKDNAILLKNDPNYIGRLAGLPEALRKAMLEGDWSVVEGCFFDNWSGRNIIRPFPIPAEWLRFRSMDWGSARPFSVGWWAVVNEEVEVESVAGTQLLPRGALIRYREWYGCAGEPNVGLKKTAEEVAEGIAELQEADQVAYGVADPSIFASDGGPSIAERMFRKGVTWRRADNTRVARRGAMGGWDQMRARIGGDAVGPMLASFHTCRDFLRTVPVLQHDMTRAEDVDTAAEDHCADEARYACMSRPWVTDKPAPAPEAKTLGQMTWDELHAFNDALRAANEEF
jgi:hypothetical protein